MRHSKRLRTVINKRTIKQYTVISYVNAVSSPSKCCVVLCSSLLWWCGMIKCPRDEMNWGEGHRLSDVALGYYWPSDHLSGGASASGPWLTVTETAESGTADKGGLLYSKKAEAVEFWKEESYFSSAGAKGSSRATAVWETERAARWRRMSPRKAKWNWQSNF